MVTIVLLGCSEIVPGTCSPNPTESTGGTEPMPIAGVGASASGDFAADPPKGPLDIGDGVGGAFNAPPRQPQDAPPPDCLQVPGSPCEEKCLADYTTAAGTCGTIESEAQRATCQDSAHSRYKNCRGSCPQQSDEKCRQARDKAYDKCMDKCKDSKCRDACFKDYVACLKECDG